MTVYNALWRLFLLVGLVGMLWALLLPRTYAATPTLTAAQLEAVKTLSADDKQRLIQQFTGGRQGGASRQGLTNQMGATDAAAAKTAKDKSKNGKSKTSKDGVSLDGEEIARLKGGDTVIVYFDQPDPQQLDPALPRLRLEEIDTKRTYFKPSQSQILYKLDRSGILEIAGVGLIPLAGLTEEEASARLQLEPLLQHKKVSIKLLPLEPLGIEALKPFGYELFKDDENGETTISTHDVPISNDYTIGPGDVVYVQTVGKENDEYYLDVKRDGSLSFPGIGTIPVAGLTFSHVKNELKKRIEKQFIGVNTYITLAELRSIRVFVTGEVEKPGSYLVSGASTVSHALMQGRGVKDIGSLRHIELRRGGRLVSTLDLYDLLLAGDARKDVRLEAGDVVLVPTVRGRVSVAGQVVRPAIYEIKNNESMKDVLDLAGGLLPSAYRQGLRVERVEASGTRRIHDVDVDKLSEFKIQSGDVISVSSVDDNIKDPVQLSGYVLHPGPFQWQKDMRVSDVLPNISVLRDGADLDYVLIKRTLPPDYRLSVLSVNLRDIFNGRAAEKNILLKPRDEVVVLPRDDKRILQVQPVIDQLQAQARSSEPSQVVRVIGQVLGAGSYPLEAGMRVSDLIRAGGGLSEAAFTLDAELTRSIVKPGEAREIQHIAVDLVKAMQLDTQADLVLQPFDMLNVKQTPLWTEQDQVEIVGEVKFPGMYAIRRGETLSQLLKRAGGLTDFAYPQGAVFTREDLRKREQERMDEMASTLEAELVSNKFEQGDADGAQNAGFARQFIEKLQSTKAVGRFVIDLPEINRLVTGESKDSANDIVLKGGDKLFVPPQMQEVSVIGQVFYPTSHFYRDDVSLMDYVDKSGGATLKADTGSIYVIRANGSVELARRYWFARSAEIRPGDTIVVPFDSDRVSAMRVWGNISEIVYKLSLSAAAWSTLGLFK